MKLLMPRLWLVVSSAALVFLGLALLPQKASAEATFELSLAGPGVFNPGCPPHDEHCISEPFEWRSIGRAVDVKLRGRNIHRGKLPLPGFRVEPFFGDIQRSRFRQWRAERGRACLGHSVERKSDIFEFFYDAPFERSTFGGLSGSYYANVDLPFGPVIQATAILTNVPEPEIVSLMLAGLLLTSLVRRSGKSAHASRGARDCAMPAPVTL